MAKRYTDTDKWKKKRFRKAPNKIKLAWYYIHDNCDNGGFWEFDEEEFSHNLCGESITLGELTTYLAGQIIMIDGLLWLPGYVKSQHKCNPNELNPSNNYHKSSLECLRNVFGESLEGLDDTLSRASEGLGEGPLLLFKESIDISITNSIKETKKPDHVDEQTLGDVYTHPKMGTIPVHVQKVWKYLGMEPQLQEACLRIVKFDLAKIWYALEKFEAFMGDQGKTCSKKGMKFKNKLMDWETWGGNAPKSDKSNRKPKQSPSEFENPFPINGKENDGSIRTVSND